MTLPYNPDGSPRPASALATICPCVIDDTAHISVSTQVDPGVRIGAGVRILGGWISDHVVIEDECTIEGSYIGPRAIIRSHANITRSNIGERSHIQSWATISHAHLGSRVSIASHTHIRSGTQIGDRTIIYPHVVISVGVRIGSHVTICMDARIHADYVGDGTYIGYGAYLEERVRTGIRSRIKENVHVPVGMRIPMRSQYQG